MIIEVAAIDDYQVKIQVLVDHYHEDEGLVLVVALGISMLPIDLLKHVDRFDGFRLNCFDFVTQVHLLKIIRNQKEKRRGKININAIRKIHLNEC